MGASPEFRLRIPCSARRIVWGLLLAAAGSRGWGRPSELPALPPLPTASAPIANYRIEAELNPVAKLVTAQERVTWKNTSGKPISEYYFHLYLNAFKNNRSSYWLERQFKPEAPSGADSPWGFCRVDAIRLLGTAGEVVEDLKASLQFVQPDDQNAEDQTVFRVQASRPLPPGESASFEIHFVSKLPAATDRSGYTGDFYFVAQWFPKIGVFSNGQWNCHQFHSNSELFADFGSYDVQLTLPAGYQVGATGKLVTRAAAAGRAVFRFQQDDVHDFAWAASPALILHEWPFAWPGLHPVQLRLLLQPEHAAQAERYITAAAHALRYYGESYGEYPYDTLTIIDPPYNSTVGGMEYPTLITAGTRWWAPAGVQSPEGVTVHEAGHQFWYGLAANNEFEEAWLDEGINTYCTARVLEKAYGRDRYVKRFFGGLPVVFEEFRFGRHDRDLVALRQHGTVDAMARRSWEYLDTYVLNSYYKPAIVLYTLERLLGEELLTRALRGYQHRWRYGHPTTKDFIAALNEFSGRDLSGFFRQTFFSNGVLDYAVHSIANRDESDRQGLFEDRPSSQPLSSDADAAEASNRSKSGKGPRYQAEVVVRRLGEVRWPVDLLLRFEDGSVRYESWDGAYTWKRWTIPSHVRLVEATLDPDDLLPMDINRTNNSRKLTSAAPWAAGKWASRWLFWFQHLLEVMALAV